MTEQIKEPSEHNRMAALQLIARQSVTRLAEILDSKDEAIATARKELPEAQAEVERLTRMRDDVRDAYAAQGAILAAARMEIESLKANVSGWQVKAGDAGNKLVRSEQEAQRLTRMRDFERDAAGTMADQYSILAEERNALKAEVERLRLPSEAWRTLELYREAERNGTSEEAENARWVHIPIRDAARARAAKEKGA